MHGILTTDNLFDGTISTPTEHYYIEPAKKYSKDLDQRGIHSVVYKVSDVKMHHFDDRNAAYRLNGEHHCASERLHTKLKRQRAEVAADEVSHSDSGSRSVDKTISDNNKKTSSDLSSKDDVTQHQTASSAKGKQKTFSTSSRNKQDPNISASHSSSKGSSHRASDVHSDTFVMIQAVENAAAVASGGHVNSEPLSSAKSDIYNYYFANSDRLPLQSGDNRITNNDEKPAVQSSNSKQHGLDRRKRWLNDEVSCFFLKDFPTVFLLSKFKNKKPFFGKFESSEIILSGSEKLDYQSLKLVPVQK